MILFQQLILPDIVKEKQNDQLDLFIVMGVNVMGIVYLGNNIIDTDIRVSVSELVKSSIVVF